jgi:anti-anti-sigma factor
MSVFHISEESTSTDARGRAGALVLVASGEMDYSASPQLRERMLGHIATGWRHLVLDLSAVTFIDSTAIGALVGAVARLQEVGGGSVRVVCNNHNERVLRIFDMAGVASLIALHRSRAEAFSALAAAPTVDVRVRAWAEQATARGARAQIKVSRRCRTAAL